MASREREFWIDHAMREAQSTYPDLIAGRQIDVVGKRKSLLKFGRNVNMSSGTRATIWDVGVANETYATAGTNPINRVSSSSGSDTGIIRIEGHYDTGTNEFRFVVLDVTLSGQTSVALSTATVVADAQGSFSGSLARVSRVANLTATALVGDVYVYQSGQTVTAGVPQDLTKTHAKVRGASGLNQTNKAATTISTDDIFFITNARVGVARQAAAFVDFALQIREAGEVFREQAVANASRDSGSLPMLDSPPYKIVPPNADVRIVGTSSANSVTGTATFNGILGRLV